MSAEVDAIIVATGGTLLLFIFYLVLLSVQSPYLNAPVLIFTLVGGFVGLFIIAIGLHRLIKSAVGKR